MFLELMGHFVKATERAMWAYGQAFFNAAQALRDSAGGQAAGGVGKQEGVEIPIIRTSSAVSGGGAGDASGTMTLGMLPFPEEAAGAAGDYFHLLSFNPFGSGYAGGNPQADAKSVPVIERLCGFRFTGLTDRCEVLMGRAFPGDLPRVEEGSSVSIVDHTGKMVAALVHKTGFGYAFRVGNERGGYRHVQLHVSAGQTTVYDVDKGLHMTAQQVVDFFQQVGTIVARDAERMSAVQHRAGIARGANSPVRLVCAEEP